MIKFCEQISIANVTRWWGASYTSARANWKGTFVVKPKSNAEIAKMVYLRFWPKAMLSNAGL